MMRRLKTEVGIQLPPKRHQRMPLYMLPKQVLAYRQAMHDMLITLADGSLLDIPDALAKLTRLRQITSGLSTIHLADGSAGPDISAKLDAAMDIIVDRAGDPIVVFSLFRNTAKSLRERLKKAGINYEQLTFDMEPEEIEAAKDRFAQGDVPVMVGTIGVGGVGHTLVAADTLVFIDTHFNPDKQLQAEDRIHRIGQVRPCLIIRLHIRHTVDDFVERITRRKERMTRGLITAALKESLADSERFL